jgi:hypothetical protein
MEWRWEKKGRSELLRRRGKEAKLYFLPWEKCLG